MGNAEYMGKKQLVLSLVTLLVNTILLLEWMRRSDSNWLMIISCLFLVIEILLLLVWREIGLRDVVSSTMMPRPSSFGSMKRINSESSPCRREVMSRVSLRDLQEESRLLVTLSRRNLERTSALMPSMVTSTLAQPILVLE